MGNTKIGISNFKAFGPKMQYFTKKPITLIYGPNSVGKSSLIRSLLYREYIKQPNFFDFIMNGKYKNQSTNRFGDQLSIGTFETAVHMHDVSQAINYDIEYKNSWDIASFLPLYRIFFDSINKILDQMNIDEMMESVNTYFNKEADEYNKNEILVDELLISKCKKICLIEENDLIDSDNLDKFKSFIHYALGQFLIQSIKIESSIGIGLEIEYRIYVNNELLIKCTKVGPHPEIGLKLVELYTNSKAFNLVFFKPKNLILDKQYNFNIDHLIVNPNLSIDLFNLEENYTEYLKKQVTRILAKVIAPNEEFENIYIGPIRTIPDRNDLRGPSNFYERQRDRQVKINKANENCLLLGRLMNFLRKTKYLRFLYLTIFFPKFLFCSAVKYLLSFCNSIFIPVNGMPKYIRPNRNQNHYMWYSLIENKKVRDKVSEWLNSKGKHNSSYTLDVSSIESGRQYYDKKTKIEYEIILGSELKFYDSHTKTHVHPQDMGVGISQSLPIVIACNLFKAANIFIEQPELHLHPKLQMEIADEFIRNIHEQYNDFMIETHSEHLLLRIMKRMRQTAEGTLEDESLRLTPDDVCLLYVDANNELTYLNELELDNDGTLLDPWPGGFFEEGYNERFS